MVSAEALRTADVPLPVEPADLPEEELRWCTVTLQEVLARGSRLEASVFDVEGKHAREVLERCKWPIRPLSGNNGIADSVFVPGRVKRKYLSQDDPEAIGFLGSSEMLDMKPIPYKWLPRNEPKYEQFKVEEGLVLISCSGTIGNLTYVSRTLAGFMVSQHAIRIATEYPGYIYCFLKSAIGKALVHANIYGAVISEIEPAHLTEVPIPDPPPVLKKRIHNLVMKSYALRDESNELLDQAERLLYGALRLPPLAKLRPLYFDKTTELRNYAVNLSKLAGRLDGSYHVPTIDAILRRLKKEADEITTIGDQRISKRIILPGRFARVYVQEGQGTVFFGGKQLFELDPANKKYLSIAKHSNRIKEELLLKENMIIITARGTIARTILVPNHWDGWAMSDNVIRVKPSSADIAGYLHVFLATDHGRELVRRFTYGAVVDALEPCHISQVPVPLLKDAATQTEINRLALKANKKRTKAYYVELEAIKLVNEAVIESA